MKKHWFLTLLLVLVFTLCAGVACAAPAAQIGDASYDTFDQAVSAAADGAVIELLADCETEGLNLNKDLTVEGNGHKLSFNRYGIALWGKALTFNNLTVEMNGVTSTPYTAEWNWMAICASQNASLTLNNTAMTMDGQNLNNPHAIYFCSNNKLNLNQSSLTIRNYKQDALEWDGGDGGYNFNMKDSVFTSDRNRSGITGTFVVTADHSQISVVNSTGNGSNGSHFDIKNNSTVTFTDNTAHGLSAGWLKIDNSTVTASGNGANGIHTNSDLTIDNQSVVTIQNNGCSISSQWTIPGALHFGGKTGVVRNSTLTITDNLGSGIYQKQAAGTLTIEPTANVTILRNQAVKLGKGGGVYVNGSVSWTSSTQVYNNHAGAVHTDAVPAGTAGDDIYLADGAKLTFVPVGTNWQLDGLPDCYGQIHAIDGWYVDEKNQRWNADAADPADRFIQRVDSTVITGSAALKAAHDIPSPSVVPKTGDGSHPALWLGCMLLALAGATILFHMRKRSA